MDGRHTGNKRGELGGPGESGEHRVHRELNEPKVNILELTEGFKFDPAVWGPHFWFFLQTIAMTYPLRPNEAAKKKYYDLITNFPLFIPDSQLGNRFSSLLDQFPVTPYLDSRESFMRWVNFIHNRVNVRLGKPEVGFELGVQLYKQQYAPRVEYSVEKEMMKQRVIYISIILSLIAVIGVAYNR
jgi:hypothetical protein